MPIWYQELFLPTDAKARRYHYLNLKPDVVTTDSGHRYTRNAQHLWGPDMCFFEDDLYTTRLGSWWSTEIEQHFFGPIDNSGRAAVEYFSSFSHPGANHEHFYNFMRYMSLQKLRTPKGLKYLARLVHNRNRNVLLRALQYYQNLHCAIWSEGVWNIADASLSPTKFIVSDHPVTVYNQRFYPASRRCADGGDPDIWLNGTHTIFPLSPNKVLIITNQSWARDPYGNPERNRPNPNPMRDAMFSFLSIQVGRKLSQQEVLEINYIIKLRALRFVAAGKPEWLHPERHFQPPEWNDFGKRYLLMPDPRSMVMGGEILIGYSDKRSDAFDAYGRKPWQRKYNDVELRDREFDTLHAFQGEFARKFGPVRRGVAHDMGGTTELVDSDERHGYFLSLEGKYPKHRQR